MNNKYTDEELIALAEKYDSELPQSIQGHSLPFILAEHLKIRNKDITFLEKRIAFLEKSIAFLELTLAVMDRLSETGKQ